MDTVAFNDAVSSRGSGANGLPQSEWEANGWYPVIGQGAEFIEGWSDREDLLLKPEPALVLYGGHTRRAKLVTRPFIPGPNVKILTPSPNLDAGYLFRFLEQLQIESRGYADHFPQVKRSKIPLPPLAEQKRIAGILDAADALRAERREAFTHLDTLLQSIFLDLFGSDRSKWLTFTIGDVADVQGGVQVTTKRKSLPLEVPYLRVANVYRNLLNLSEVKQIRVTQQELQRVLLKKDDLLIVEGHGNPNEIGRAALWNALINPCIHQNHLIRARFDRSRIAPLFACTYLNSDIGSRHLKRAGKTTSGLNTISVSQVRATPIPVPPLRLQNEYAAIARVVGQQKKAMHDHLDELDRLFASLQSRAFRGELDAR